MIPETVRYSGAEFDARKLLERRHMGPIPLDWTRHQFKVDGRYSDPTWTLSNWISENLHGRFTLNATIIQDGYLVVIGFEQVNDAVMFRLMDGETAWCETDIIL